MGLLNQLICASKNGNVGFPKTCTHNPGYIRYLLAIPYDTVFTAAEIAGLTQSFQETIQEGMINDVYGERFHLFGIFEGLTDDSVERQTKEWSYGGTKTVRGEKYVWTFDMIAGAMCQHKSYLAFQGRENEFRYIIIDGDRNFIGTESYDANGNLTGLAGLDALEVRQNNWRPKNEAEETMYTMTVSLSDSKQLNEYYAYVQLGFDIGRLNTVQDAYLTPITTLNGGVVTLALNSGCGGVNLVQLYPADLADPTLYAVTNTTTGATITLDTVTVTGVGANAALLFGIDDADPDYPASGAKLTITPDSISQLATAGVAYYDIKPITLTEV